jgi:hypothetical protein
MDLIEIMISFSTLRDETQGTGRYRHDTFIVGSFYVMKADGASFWSLP